MTTLELLSYLRSRDVQLWADGDQLHCSAPKGVLTPALRTELAGHKTEILTFLHEAQHVIRSTRPPLSAVSRSAELPLSFAQQRLWFLDQLEPHSPLYTVPQAIHLHGPLQVEALHQTLNAIVARHETLRTTFHAVDGIPRQVIAEHRTVVLALIDLSAWPEAARKAEAQRLMREEAQRPLDLTCDVLLRATLLRLGPAEHILLLTMHHIASDGWSMRVLSDEVATLYRAFARGAPSPLAALPIQYADYAVWQRQWLQGAVLDAQLAYWQAQLAGVPVLELPLDHPRPAVQTFRGARQPLRLPQPLTEALKALSQREGVTLFMTLLAAFQTLLQRYTGQDDIAVGSPIAGRTRAELEGLIGFFVNTLVLRTDLSGNPTFPELLGRVREVTLGAYAHQDLPFERLVEELQPERRLSHSPLFQVMLALQNAPRQTLDLPGLTVSRLEVDRGTAQFDLTLVLWEEAEGLVGTLEYNRDLFEAPTIQRLLGHFRHVLAGIVANPARRLAELPLLGTAERQQLLVAWNATAAEYPRDRCLHQLFEAQVERTPDAIAVVDDVEWTYRELNTRANRLAHHLRRHGVGPEVLVAVCMERGLEMLVSLLGILKAGGVYLPLDIDYPPERLAFMLEDSRPPVLLAQQSLLGGLPSHGAQVVCVDSEWGLIAQESEQNPPASATAESTAYVFYTSGSTGKPKGVQGYHRGVVNLCQAMVAQFGLHAQDRVMQFSSLCFDIAVEEIFPTWMSGATLVLRTEAGLPSIPAFLEAIRRRRITVLDLPTAFWHTLVNVLEMSRDPLPETLRLVVVGGEKASAQAFANWLKLGGEHIRWLNGYGPTETTVTATVHEPMRASGTYAIDGEIPIGRPIANTQVYVLDPHLQPVPIGVPGELYIGGDGLARGYLNRPELTAERFLPHPFSDQPGARLYKTGDLARYRPDGQLEFLGRLDQQVKVRGYRIEPGEVEAALTQHPAVREAVVLAREDGPGDTRLVAYVVPNQPPGPSMSDLRSFLQAKLPNYMVPSTFVMLAALPLTPNGKVDRRALPAPAPTRPALDDALVAPRTPVEAALAAIWAEILRLPQVGVHDNFFALGGHSLLATQVISRLQAAFQVDLPLRRLFEAPTVAELAQALIAHEARPGQTEKIARILRRIEGMSAEERANIHQKTRKERGNS
jgi:amino acid adenylation domain-containing protein